METTVSPTTTNRHTTRVLVISSFTCFVLLHPLAAAEHDSSKWEKQITAFEAKDRSAPVKPGGILFVGSSSIRMWKTDRCFPNRAITNRGFGGSQMADVLHYVDRIVLNYQPRVIVLYEGDNDIAAGKSPATVVEEFKQLKKRVHAELPNTKLIFLSIKPSLKRWDMYPKMKATNDQIATVCDGDSRCQFIDVSRVMLGEDGRPMAHLFAEDGLHLNENGYESWSALVAKALPSE